MKKHLILILFLLYVSCGKDSPIETPIPQVTKFIITFSSGSGGSVSIPGGSYETGANVSVTATPNSEYVFVNWSNGSTQNPLSVSVNSNQTLTANFEKRKYPLTMNIVGEGAVSEEIISAGRTTTEYNSGSVIRLTANPSDEWVFTGWSGSVSSTNNPIELTVDESKTLTSTFIKRKYPLTINIQGEGIVSEEIISAGRTTTEYTSGSIIQLTSVPSGGWGFSGWSGTVSSTENPIQLTVDEAKSITSTFLEFPSPEMTLVSSQTKMFTKGVADTLLISISSGGGFKSVELSSDWGDISSVSSPEEGSLEGTLVVQYQPSHIKNVDYTRTIAGSDNLLITLTDQNDLTLTVSYTFRTQPEPILNRNYVLPHLELKTSRSKVDMYLIRFLNGRDNFFMGCYNGENFGDPTNYNQNGNSNDLSRDIAYVDLNLDGYDDLVITPQYWDGSSDTFASAKQDIEIYFYENGSYVYQEIQNQNGSVPEAFLVTKILVGDFDNDGYPDLYCINHGTDSAPYIDENQFFLFNDLESKGFFTQIDNTYNRNSHFGASADIDNDGDLDIYAGGLFPCENGERGCDFLINNGGRNFSPGDLLNDTSYLGSLKYFTRNISTADLYDVDEDGKIDLLLHGHGSKDNSDGLPWFTQEEIDNMPFISSSGKIMFANSEGKYSLSEMKYIPHIPGFNKGLDFNIFDLDGDGQKEIIILLTGDGTLGEWNDNDGNQTNDNQITSNYYQGYQIQICQLDENRNIIDVTDQFMDGNGQTGVDLGCDNTNFMFLQIGDYDDNGKLDMYCEDSRIGPNFVRWEWNGFKFIKMTES